MTNGVSVGSCWQFFSQKHGVICFKEVMKKIYGDTKDVTVEMLEAADKMIVEEDNRKNQEFLDKHPEWKKVIENEH